jgi:hypothetical protein
MIFLQMIVLIYYIKKLKKCRRFLQFGVPLEYKQNQEQVPLLSATRTPTTHTTTTLELQVLAIYSYYVIVVLEYQVLVPSTVGD